jgi:hypothetical protein
MSHVRFSPKGRHQGRLCGLEQALIMNEGKLGSRSRFLPGGVMLASPDQLSLCGDSVSRLKKVDFGRNRDGLAITVVFERDNDILNDSFNGCVSVCA